MKRISLLLSVALVIPFFLVSSTHALMDNDLSYNKTNNELLTDAIKINQTNSRRSKMRTQLNYNNRYINYWYHQANKQNKFVDGNANELNREGDLVTPGTDELRTTDRFRIGQSSRITFGKDVLCYYVEGNTQDCQKRHKGISMRNHKVYTEGGRDGKLFRADAGVEQSWLRRMFRNGTVSPEYDFSKVRTNVYFDKDIKRNYGADVEFIKQYEKKEITEL